MDSFEDATLDEVLQGKVTLTVEMRQNMESTAKWTTIISGVFILLNVLGLVWGIFALGAFLSGDDSGGDALIFMGLGVIGGSFYLSIGLYQYGIQLKRLASGKEPDAWAVFLQKQRKFWQVATLLLFILFGILFCFL